MVPAQVSSKVTPRVVVVDHYDSYTWNLVHLVAAVTGVLPTVVQHDETTPEFLLGFDHIVLSPGPGHPAVPQDFSVGTTVLREGDRPVLGVCLGMQGLVTAYGGTVGRDVPAHGELALITHDGKGVFRGLPQDFKAVRYHSLQAIELPDSLVVTATCPGVLPEGPPAVMGVRHVSRPLEGVQFHPESILSEYGEALMANFLR
ncbi:anthranilate synthase component II [Nocardioides sp.]|uniref:anthranilate synthase component II n=1 Tax=Nocardioides sp. TaxID=35761 RepID=UPI003D1086C8